MTDTATQSPTAGQHPEVPEDLARCAMVIESAVEHLIKEKQPPLAIASALLGGSLGFLPRTTYKYHIIIIPASAAYSLHSDLAHAHTSVQNPL